MRKHKLDIVIEEIYRCTLFYEFDREDSCEVADKVDKYFYKHGLKTLRLTSSTGGPCFGPYLRIDGRSKEEVYKLAVKVKNYIMKFKSARLSS